MAPPTLPRREVSLTTGQGPIEQLISLSVSRIEVQRGELLWEDKKMPFDFAARDLALLLNYSLLRRQYEAHLVGGKRRHALSGLSLVRVAGGCCAGSGPRTR